MISRRLLRIKVLHCTYAYFKSDSGSIEKSEKELFHSIEKAYELYYLLMLLMIEIRNYAQSRIDLARAKKRPTTEDLHPNEKFIKNRVLDQLSNNDQILRYIELHGISWVKYPELIKNLYNSIADTQYFKLYMASEEDNYEWDKKVVLKIISEALLPSEELHQALEEQSIYWNDDLDFVTGMIMKTVKGLRESDGEYARMMPMFKNDEDREFVKTLFRKTIINNDKYTGLISDFTKNWDVERIAFMDILLMQIAINELVEFPSIPVKVSLNEYIEISKYYSTKKSSTFINGILDKIIHKLKQEKVIVKQGRGLIGEAS